MNAYKSCGCFHCRHTPSSVRGRHKRIAHRALRRATKDAIRFDREVPVSVSSGRVA